MWGFPFNMFPGTNMHDIDLDWIIKTVRELWNKMDNFTTDTIETLIKETVDSWLDEHPEATTTVVDGSIVAEKLNPEFLAEVKNSYVTPEMFGAYGDGAHDDTLAVQQAFDHPYDVIMSGTYLVSKNTELEYEHNDEPCLIIRVPKRITGGVIKVDTHAQTAIDVRADNVELDAVTIYGYGSFPDVGISGRGEKGALNQGYYDPTLSPTHQFSSMRNNSIDTSGWHGFEGNTASVWGTWGNGYIANCGSGVWIFGCRNVNIHDCIISGFNFEGITAGIRDNYTTENINIHNCKIHDCYNAGIGTYNVKHVNVENNTIYAIGHPTVLADPYGFNILDPGYGITFSTYQSGSGDEYNRTEYAKCILNNIENCVRIGIDVHGGNDILISLNKVRNAYAFACEMGSFSGSGQTTNVELSKNEFINCNVISFRNSTTFANNRFSNLVIKENLLYLHPNYTQSYGAIDVINAGEGGVLVDGNRISNIIAGTRCTFVNADYATIRNNYYNNGILQFYIPHGLIEGNKNYAAYKSMSSNAWLAPVYKDGLSATSDSLFVKHGEKEYKTIELNQSALVSESGTTFGSIRVNESGATWANYFTGIPAAHFNMVSVSGFVAGNRDAKFLWYESGGEVVVFMQVTASGQNVDASTGYNAKFCIEFEIV